MKTVRELRGDIEYWTEKLKEAEQRLRERTNELPAAISREAEQNKHKTP